MGASTPITGSHEPSGVVAALGDKAKAAGRFNLGDRVVAVAITGMCGECPDCKEYNPVYCRNLTG